MRRCRFSNFKVKCEDDVACCVSKQCTLEATKRFPNDIDLLMLAKARATDLRHTRKRLRLINELRPRLEAVRDRGDVNEEFSLLGQLGELHEFVSLRIHRC